MKLEVDDVHVAYGRTQVLFGVSLVVPNGSLVCLLGRDGAGKTTLLDAIMGLLPLRSGVVRVDGEDIDRMVAGARTPTYRRALSGIGYVPERHQVFPHLTAWENLEVADERRRHADPTAIDEALDVFPALRPLLKRTAGLLSGGQARQLAIARALVMRPKLLIVDEPDEGIQRSIILEIEDAVAELHRCTGMSILLVEHHVELALRLAERYAVMDRGRIVASGATADASSSDVTDLLAV